MSYFTDDSPHKSSSEPLIVDKNNMPEPELGFWDQNVQRYLNRKNADVATARTQNIAKHLEERSQILEQELGPNYIEKLKDFGYERRFGAPAGDPWLSTGRDEDFEKSIKNLRSILPAETRAKLFAGDELEVAAAETARQIDQETSKKLQNTKYGWWAGLLGDISAHVTDPLEFALLGIAPNAIAGRIIAQGGKTSLASRTGIYAGTEAGVVAAFETPNQFLNVKGYKEELGIKYTNSDAAQAVFAATILSAVGAGAFEIGAGGLRKLRTGEWGISEYNSHVAKHFDQMSPELRHAHELVDQATENGRLNPFGDTPEGVQRHIDETLKAEQFVNQGIRDVPQGDIEAAQNLAKEIEAQSNELPDVQKLRDEFLAEHQLTPAPKPEGDIPDGFAFLNDVANGILPENVRVQVVDEIERAVGGNFQRQSTKTDTPEFKKWSDNAPLVKYVDADKYEFKTNEKVVVEGFHGTSLDTGEQLAYMTGQEIIPRPVNGIDEFKTNANPVDLSSEPRSMGTFFASNPKLASEYSKLGTYNYNNSQVYPVYITMKKPLVVDAKGSAFDKISLDVEIEPGVKLRAIVDDDGGIYGRLDQTNTNAVTQYARHAGYDGVVFKNIIDNANADLPQSTNFAVFEPTQIKSINNRGAFDPDDPRMLYQLGNDQPKAKSTTDSLTGTHIEAPDELYNWLDVEPAKFQADYTKIAKKREATQKNNPLSAPEAVRDHVEHTLGNAVFALRHREGNWNLISIDGIGRLTSVDLRIKKRQYRVVTAHTLSNGQLEDKIRGVFKEHGEDGFKWKVDPRRSQSGVPQEDPSFVIRMGINDQLSADDIIRYIREMQGFQGRAGHPSVFSNSLEDGIQGAFRSTENLIQIARSAVDPTATLRHEAIHALKALDLFKAEEWSLLEETARQMDWIKKHDIEARYKAEFDGDEAARQRAMLEEAIAEEFSKWRRGELQVTQEIKTIFERIQALLGQITDALRRAGINDFEDVFKRIESGEIKNRQLPELRDDVQYEIGVGQKGETVTPRELVERADYELQQAEAIGLCLKVA